MVDTKIIIPARYESTRFPGKALAPIKGKAMIRHVADNCAKAVGRNSVIIATDDDRIKNAIYPDYDCVMTNKNCLTGTDRVYEAAMLLELDDDSFIINVQGDEPLVDPKDIHIIIQSYDDYKNKNSVFHMYSDLQAEWDSIADNATIKIVKRNENNDNFSYLVYASRHPIPGFKLWSDISFKWFYKQVCIYGYTIKTLKAFYDYGKKIGKSPLETPEDIEILRFIDLNIPVYMYKTDSIYHSVDFSKDIEKVEKIMENKDVKAN